MRGKRFQYLYLVCVGGLIPAHAGKTVVGLVAAGRSGAHPRACGENCCGAGCRRSFRGSSPRMRGKLGPFPAACECGGLIPAHAGKTPFDFEWNVEGEPHPRACGENPMSLGCLSLISGSSPRMRGKHGRQARPQAKHGLIPAHAGKTFSEIKD